MPILTDAELVLGLSRHLSAYAMGSDRAALSELEFAGWVYDVAFRLRGSTTTPAKRVKAIGTDVGLGARSLRDVMVTLESMGWVSVLRDTDGQPISISESMPAAPELVSASDRLFSVLSFGGFEQAVITGLRATSTQPMLVEDVLAATAGAGATEEQCVDALRHLTALGLVRRVVAEDGREVVYNPNVWTQGDGIAKSALRAADANATSEVQALLEELADNPAMPEIHVTSTEERWVKFAVSQGLVQRSVIQTSEGVEQGFLFSPHLARDPFGGTAGDASGHVRQLVGSMVYATTFARDKLFWPSTFLRALVRNGVAGNVPSIGTDYPMLEKAGIIRVVQGSGRGFKMELLQSDVAEDALKLLSGRSSGSGTSDATVFEGQRSYVHVEKARARLAMSADTDEVEQARLIAALRDVTIRRSFGGS